MIKNKDEEIFIKSLFDKGIKLERIYSAVQNGSSALTFHSFCDNKGPNLVIVESENH